jgi:hypothetical protein
MNKDFFFKSHITYTNNHTRTLTLVKVYIQIVLYEHLRNIEPTKLEIGKVAIDTLL